MATSERARTARRARLKQRREEEDFWKVPTGHLPKFIQEILEKNRFQPIWKQCYKNAFTLGYMIENEGHDVRYCEAVVASHNSPFPRSHAWLRVDGVDYNITSEDGEALHIYSNYPMVVMPIHKMRPSGGDKYEDTPYLGRSLSEFSEHPRVKPYFHSNVLPEMISQYQSNSILEIERTFGE